MKPDSDGIFSNAEAYEAYVGRWSRLVAPQFVAWLDLVPGLTWLDVGAGTGVLSLVTAQKMSPAKIVGVDLSVEYIDYARQHIHDHRIEFRVEDAASIAVETPQFDAAVAGLLLNFVPSPQQVLKNMIQTVKPGGTIAAYVWDYGGRMDMMRHFWKAAMAVDPAAQSMDAGQRFAICKPDNLRALFQSVSLSSVDVVALDIQTRFKDFDDYWLPFLGAQGSVASYLRALDDDRRSALQAQLQRQLPISAGGTIALVARAWAVKGIK